MRTLLCLSFVAFAMHAHEIGTTRVTAHFSSDGAYDIEIAADATALAEKFGPVAGDVTAAQLNSLLPTLERRRGGSSRDHLRRDSRR
jgi:hypothetical protein